MPLYKGYVETKGKASIEKLKNRSKWKTYDEVKNLNGFGGVLADDTILIDIDDSEPVSYTHLVSHNMAANFERIRKGQVN